MKNDRIRSRSRLFEALRYKFRSAWDDSSEGFFHGVRHLPRNAKVYSWSENLSTFFLCWVPTSSSLHSFDQASEGFYGEIRLIEVSEISSTTMEYIYQSQGTFDRYKYLVKVAKESGAEGLRFPSLLWKQSTFDSGILSVSRTGKYFL